jgi:outer membrane protein OmpA-like peptidoglycan-associated protein
VNRQSIGWALLAIAASFVGTVQAADPATEGFQMEITPYAWLQGVDGTLSVADRRGSFDQGFSDLVDNIDLGVSGLVVASFNRFVFFGQYDYADLGLNGDDVSTTVATSIDGDIEQNIGTVAVGWRFGPFGRSTVDVLVGVRDLDLDTELRSATLTRQNDIESTDTIVMLRPSFHISDRWRFNPTFSYAVSGDADEHYELQPQIQYQFSDNFAARFGYRRLHYETESGVPDTTSYRKFDGDFSGLILGVGWTFPAPKEPVVAAAPPPPPAPRPAPPPPAPPKDSDGDGVVDANDLCPGTAPGTRVGPHGCDCDVTIQLQFAFDSAELTDADKAELDRAAQRLIDLRFVSGTAEGHTDSMGDEAYNQGLSERRAQAVVDYLATKGVARDRFKVVGLGETKPIADNATEAGRALNRRVVLRRTDCD